MASHRRRAKNGTLPPDALPPALSPGEIDKTPPLSLFNINPKAQIFLKIHQFQKKKKKKKNKLKKNKKKKKKKKK
ncbi:hypothetical protein ACVGXT_04215, partial [Enterobacter intestinihominis]